MEPRIEGEVVSHKVPRLKSVRKFIEKRIKQWPLTRSMAEAAGVTTVFFYASFEKVGIGPEVLCALQVRIGNQLWRSTAVCRGVHQALVECLAHLDSKNQQALLLRLSS